MLDKIRNTSLAGRQQPVKMPPYQHMYSLISMNILVLQFPHRESMVDGMTYKGSIDIIPEDKKQYYNVDSQGPKHSDMHGNQLVSSSDVRVIGCVCSVFECRAIPRTSACTTTTA